jgi:hypothetical protein
MKIVEILIGVMRDGAPHTETFAVEGSTTIPVPNPEELALAVRETMARATRETAKETLPFIRITAREGADEISIADDAAAGLRLYTETQKRGLPLIVEAKAGDEETIDALLARVALAFSAEDNEQLFFALGREDFENTTRAPSSEYEAAQQRAKQLEQAVRRLDDRMTKSVVPDWLWIASGFGGIGVLMTTVALLYPDLRSIIVPIIVVVAVLGFAAYARMSMREMKRRGKILNERRELRARREDARREARMLAGGSAPPSEGSGEQIPAVIAGAPAGATKRQVISFVNKPA